MNAVTEVSAAPKQDLERFAYEQIKTAIVKGIYPPGYQIVEELVADQLSMSRSPVRTAIKRLQTEGFLEKRTNRRVYVALGDHQRTVNTLYIRKALEGVAAYQAAMNRTEEDLEEIRASPKWCSIIRMGTRSCSFAWASRSTARSISSRKTSCWRRSASMRWSRSLFSAIAA